MERQKRENVFWNGKRNDKFLPEQKFTNFENNIQVYLTNMTVFDKTVKYKK